MTRRWGLSRRAWKIVAVVASALVIIGTGAASYFAHPPVSDRFEALTYYGDPVTLTLGATGDGTTRVTYTCADSLGIVDTCGPEKVPASLNPWRMQVTVPEGTVVSVRASGGVIAASCSISDAADENVLAHSNTGECETVARK